MKFKAFILGLFVFAFAATAHAQHTPSNNKAEQIEKAKPYKYKTDRKVLSRKQAQKKTAVTRKQSAKNKRANIAKRKNLDKKRRAAKQGKSVEYQKKRATRNKVKYAKRAEKRQSKAIAKKMPSKALETQ